MTKTLVIAEKPSVGRDISKVLLGTFEKVGDEYKTPAVGPDFDLAAYLREHGVEVVDKRPSGGGLWAVADKSAPPVFAALKRAGIRFKFAAGGGKATKRRPAWHTTWPKT